jgi:hypothetical protein
VLPIQPKKGVAGTPLNCRIEIPANQPKGKNTHFNPYFFSVWTQFGHRQKTPSSVCQKEHFTGLFEIQSNNHPPCTSGKKRKYIKAIPVYYNPSITKGQIKKE